MPSKLKNIPSLDGLRGVAVLLVLFYHCSVKNFFRGGFIGVDIFFTISGFLITSILLKEWDSSGKIDLKAFYIRRARRLLPALLLMITVFVMVGILFSDKPVHFYKDAFWALSYVANWARIYSNGYPDFLGHTWSLAIEEQFYIIWPFLLIVGLRTSISKVTLFLIVLSAAIASAILRYKMQIDGSDVVRIYNGLDTRADPILLGCAAAILFRVVSRHMSYAYMYILRHLALAAAGGLFVISTYCFYFNPDMIKYGYFGAAILSTIIVFSLPLLQGHGLLHDILIHPILSYVGKISYGLYLWHYPILRMLNDYYHAGSINRIALGLFGSLAVSILSYELFEKRFLVKRSSSG